MRMRAILSISVATTCLVLVGGCGSDGDSQRSEATAMGGTTAFGGNAAESGATEAGGLSATGGTSMSAGQGLTGGSTTGVSSGGGAGSGGGTSGSPSTGGLSSTGGALATGGSPPTGGAGGASGNPAGGTPIAGSAGASGSGGDLSGSGGGLSGSGGGPATGGSAGSAATGGTAATAGGDAGGSSGSAGVATLDCTASVPVSTNATGSGPHEVIVETNVDPGINEGTIYRPSDLGGAERYPIFVWGEGGCSLDGLSNASSMAEIASHGYFVIADGTPNGSGSRGMDRSNMEAMGAPLLAYIDWAIAESEKPCSAYYQSLETTRIASNGFSCGGLMAQATITDPRIVTWGVTSSGMAGADQAFYDPIHTPVLFVEGGPSDMAYDGALEGYGNTSSLGVPVMWFSKDIGHGGDLFEPGGGDFTRINLAWLNWWLKGDETATGKDLLVGAGCTYCSDSAWDVMSESIP